jgi:preprotein translocase subunit YajC
MDALFILAVTFALLWAFFILPRQRQVRAHQRLVASLEAGDDVVLTAGIFGRIVAVRPDDVSVEVAPGVDLRVARQAVLRRVEVEPADMAVEPAEPTESDEPPEPDADAGPDHEDPPSPSEPR